MLFEDPPEAPSRGTRQTRRRRRRSSAAPDSPDRRNRSAFHAATRLPETTDVPADRSTAAWLAVLGLLVLGVAAFAWFLQQERGSVRALAGEAPSNILAPFIDPILAPLETGESGYSPETLAEIEDRFRGDKDKANIDDREIFALAATIAGILREAVEDRSRHIDRLLRLGAPVQNAGAPDETAKTRMTETERRHLETAVGISWQRNSGAYRNRVEELGLRLMQLERGRFSGTDSAVAPGGNPDS